MLREEGGWGKQASRYLMQAGKRQGKTYERDQEQCEENSETGSSLTERQR